MFCKLKDYRSNLFPVIMYWPGGSAVFPSAEIAMAYAENRFGVCHFVDARQNRT